MTQACLRAGSQPPFRLPSFSRNGPGCSGSSCASCRLAAVTPVTVPGATVTVTVTPWAAGPGLAVTPPVGGGDAGDTCTACADYDALLPGRLGPGDPRHVDPPQGQTQPHQAHATTPRPFPGSASFRPRSPARPIPARTRVARALAALATPDAVRLRRQMRWMRGREGPDLRARASSLRVGGGVRRGRREAPILTPPAEARGADLKSEAREFRI